MTMDRSVWWAVLARSLAVQGSWNYETLTGTGFGFAILPALRRLYPDPAALDAAVGRHETPFNSHPYLAPLALGAVIRLELDGEPPEVINRFKAALRGSLGTLGDQLVWAGWRPLCVLAALALMVAGAPWYVAVLAFLVVYNIGHLALMMWGLSVGFSEGRYVAERLRGSVVRHTHGRLMKAAAFVASLTFALVAVAGVPGLAAPTSTMATVALVGAVAGAGWGERARRVGFAAVAVLVLIGVLAGTMV